MLAQADELPSEHPDAVAIRRATAGIFEGVKAKRRSERRYRMLANDRAVTALTAKGAAEPTAYEPKSIKHVPIVNGDNPGR